MDEDLPASDPGPSSAKLASFTGPSASTSSVAGPEGEVGALASMASAIYPLARAEGLRGLAAFLEKGNAGSGVAECCYGCAVELLRDEDEGIRLAAVRLVSFRQLFGISVSSL
jgi:integrator complex subunit 4